MIIITIAINAITFHTVTKVVAIIIVKELKFATIIFANILTTITIIVSIIKY